MDQKKFKGNLLDSLPSKKMTLYRRIRQKIILRRLIRRIKTLRKTAEEYEQIQESYFETVRKLSEDTPKGSYQKIGVEK